MSEVPLYSHTVDIFNRNFLRLWPARAAGSHGSLSLSHNLPLSLSLSHTFPLSPSLSHTHTLPLSFSLSLDTQGHVDTQGLWYESVNFRIRILWNSSTLESVNFGAKRYR